MSLPSLNENEKNKNSLPSLDMPPLEDDFIEDDFYDEDEDSEFEEVSIDDVHYEDDEQMNREIYVEASSMNESELPEITQYEKTEDIDYATEDDYNPDYENDVKVAKAQKHKYVDKKNKKIVPTGGKRSKTKIKSSDFDDRKNTLATTKILRAIVMFIILVIFVLGIKNTFFPSHVYTEEQIKQFARLGAGQTGFPEEKGQAYVESFMQAYLTFDREKPELNEVLNYYYGENSFANLTPQQTRIEKGLGAKQEVLIGPKVFEITLLTDYSALYKVSAYVSNTDGTSSSSGRATGRWLSFAINVYYNSKTDSLAITKDSPSIIPPYRIANQGSVPIEASLGNGRVNQEILPALTPTINGFVQAYASASISSHESIIQYIDNKEDINLYDGFGGAVALDGDPNQAIQKTVYDSDDGYYRVDVTVRWIDKLTSTDDKVVKYTSRYVMKIKSIGDGKYLVNSFKPYLYFAQ